MAEAPKDDTIRFKEAGALIEIFGPAIDGTRMVAITDASGELHGHEARGFEDACRHVDAWLDTHVGEDAPGRFRGLRFLVWEHEGHSVRESGIATRGRFLETFEDGTSPDDVAGILSWRQGWGDVVLEIRDGDGRLLLDNRPAARRLFELWNREDRAYDLDVLDARMEGIETPPSPAP